MNQHLNVRNAPFVRNVWWKIRKFLQGSNTSYPKNTQANWRWPNDDIIFVDGKTLPWWKRKAKDANEYTRIMSLLKRELLMRLLCAAERLLINDECFYCVFRWGQVLVSHVYLVHLMRASEFEYRMNLIHLVIVVSFVINKASLLAVVFVVN